MRYLKHPLLYIVFVLLLAGLFFAVTAAAVESKAAGRIVAIRGNAVAIDVSQKPRTLKMKSPVFESDTIHTKAGRVQIIFQDKTIITLGRNTVLQITRHLWQPENPDSALETHVKEGSFRIMGGAITRISPDNFKTTTPSGTIGIRGSMYAGFVKDDFLEVFFQGGKGIFVKNNFGSVDISKPGFSTTVNGPLSAPIPPEKTDPDRLIELDNTLNQTEDEGQQDSPESDSPSDADQPLPQTDTENSGNNSGKHVNSVPVQEEDTQTAESLSGTAGTDQGITDSESTPALATETISENPLIAFNDPQESSPIITASVDKPDTMPTNLFEPIIIVKEPLPSDLIPSTSEAKVKELLRDLYSFTGDRSSSVPSTGIWAYKGTMVDQVNNENNNNIIFIVNWSNGRIFGLENSTHTEDNNFDTGFGYGIVNSDGSFSNIRIFGSDAHEGGKVLALAGSETFGHFYGTSNRYLGSDMEGYDINLQDATDRVFWNDIIAAQVDTKTLTTPAGYTGTASWNGFFVGVSENISAPATDRRIFSNYETSEFTLTINKDSGTVSGSMSGADFSLPSNILIDSLTIGNASDRQKSAYIKNDLLAAALEGNAIHIFDSSTAVKSRGSYLVTKEGAPLSTHTTWGYWETAYVDPSNNATYHVHVPYSMWVAGEQTAATRVQSYWIDNNLTGVYKGLAKGIIIDSSGNITALQNGRTNLTIDFNAYSTSPVSGSISFTGHTLTIDSANSGVTSSGFSANIVGSATSNAVKGAFFGPDAEAIAGNFNAAKSGNRYHGIFAGNRP